MSAAFIPILCQAVAFVVTPSALSTSRRPRKRIQSTCHIFLSPAVRPWMAADGHSGRVLVPLSGVETPFWELVGQGTGGTAPGGETSVLPPGPVEALVACPLKPLYSSSGSHPITGRSH